MPLTRQPVMPANPVLFYVFGQRDADDKMIFIVVLVGVIGMADRDLRARVDICHPGSVGSHLCRSAA